MKVAITYEKGEVFQHFGHTEKLKIYEIENEEIISENILDTSAHGHELLVKFLKDNNVDILICGGIGNGAKKALEEAHIQLLGGVSGNVQKVIKDYILNKLKYNENVECEHHHNDANNQHCENHKRCEK